MVTRARVHRAAARLRSSRTQVLVRNSPESQTTVRGTAAAPGLICAPSITHHKHVCPITLHHASHSPLPACDPPIPNSSPLRRSASCEGDRRRALASQEAPAFHRARAGLDQPCRKLQHTGPRTDDTHRAWLTASNASWASRGATTHQ